MGSKSFEQSAGFLRIANSKNPLDASAVHPESYCIVENIADKLGCNIHQLISDLEMRKKIKINEFTSPEIGLLTLNDILKELEKPGRDPRETIKIFEYAEGVNSIKDLNIGMILPGLVTNITNFGAFIDIGIKQDGLVHISHLANKFIKDPNEAVKLGQAVQVKVVEIDENRKRIQLSIKDAN